MVDEENVVEGDKKDLPKKKPKSLKSKYEIILVAEKYLVYKTKQGNVWMQITDSKKYKVGDTIEV